MQLISPDTKIDFVGQSRFFSFVSLALVAGAIALIAVKGFNYGIDFAGGTVVQIQVPEELGPVDEGVLRQAVAEMGYADAGITRFGDAVDRAFRVSLPTSQEQNPQLSNELITGLEKQLGGPVVMEKVESIGPRVGEEVRGAGVRAMLISWGLILLYIWVRFDLRYAPGAVAALIHDVLITAGVFVVLGLEFNLQVLAALLVVVGYSLNDTIVIYDRIRENLELRGAVHLEDVVNQSINQTLSRTLLTTMTTLAVVGALLLFGGPVIRDFALAMLIGVTIGTYSTIYVASALLIFLERRFGETTSPTAKATA